MLEFLLKNTIATPITDGGIPISVSAARMILTALPSELPEVRLKLKVTAGNCSWWAMASGAVVRSILANELSGTCWPPLAPT